jgi:putative pyruvate formate lyase activating enzyme
MPTGTSGSAEVMRILADISPDMYVNIMGQYRPAGKTAEPRYARINRPITMEEVREAYQAAREAGLWRFDKR